MNVAVDNIRPKARAIFVACPSYHGATLLSLLLNNHTHISALGDTNPSRVRDSLCACGERFRACGFWRTVTERLDLDRFSDSDTLLPVLPPYRWPLSSHRPFEGRTENAFVRLAGRSVTDLIDSFSRVTTQRGSDGVADYARIWTGFYTMVAELHGTSVVIDGSKSLRKIALMANQLGERNITVIHLIRDPRGFIASWRRHHDEGDLRALAWRWEDRHARIEGLGTRVRYLRVRYEDLTVQPEREIERIFDFLGLDSEPIIGPPRSAAKHHVVGNVNSLRFNGGVALDERWRVELTRKEQADALWYARKRAGKYGYS